MEIICNVCKAKLPDDSEFCQYCGTPVNNVSEDYVFNNSTLNNVSKLQKTSKDSMISTILAIFVVSLIVVVIVIFSNYLNNSNNRPTINNVAVWIEKTNLDPYSAGFYLELWQSEGKVEQTIKESGELYIVSPGKLEEKIDKWCFSADRKVGDCDVINTASGCYICYISGFNL